MRGCAIIILALLAVMPALAHAARDYYDMLDVPRDAHVSIIKKSYRRLARLYHPDKHPGDAKMEAKFKDISKAYEVLTDKEKRQRYDSFGEQGLEGGGHNMGGGFGGFHGGSNFQMNIDPSMFESMFSGFGGGFDGGFDGGRRRYRRQQHQQRKICFHNKVCENGSCFMVKECKP